MRSRKVLLTLRITFAAILIFLIFQSYGSTLRILLSSETTLGNVVTVLPEKDITTLTFLAGNDIKNEIKLTDDDILSDMINRLSNLEVKEKIKSDQNPTDQFDSIWLDVQGTLKVILNVSEDRNELLVIDLNDEKKINRWYSIINKEDINNLVSTIMEKKIN
ncbi:hypothetical protein [Paenibacillus sp. HW567]|uniref:hypothetical protein n=1 Tax=Paenibacillus sp. HW567 TaxID=1034769 RepID=UPI00037C8AD5|nr:hypothetical protein [Paenibacillus sp. HW567]